MKILIVTFLFLSISFSQIVIPELSETEFDELVSKNLNNPLVILFYQEYCESDNYYVHLASTWEAVYQEMNGSYYQFYNIEMIRSAQLIQRLGIFVSPTIAVIENKTIYIYDGILKNVDALKEFIINYKTQGVSEPIPETYSQFKYFMKIVHRQLHMFYLIYEYNTESLQNFLMIIFLHLVGIIFAWRMLDKIIEEHKRKQKSE